MYNFGLHGLKNGDGIMYLWSETDAKRGKSDVISCLKASGLCRHRTASHSVLLSDSCVNQNKNLDTVTLLASLVHERHYSNIDLPSSSLYLPTREDPG